MTPVSRTKTTARLALCGSDSDTANTLMPLWGMQEMKSWAESRAAGGYPAPDSLLSCLRNTTVSLPFPFLFILFETGSHYVGLTGRELAL